MTSDKLVVYKEFGQFKVTNKRNYDAQIRNASQILTMKNAETFDDVVFCLKNHGIKEEDIIYDKLEN